MGSAVAGVGWNTALLIMMSEILIGGLVIFLFLNRRRRPVITPAPVTSAVAVAAVPEAVRQEPVRQEPARVPQVQVMRDNAPIAWDDILPGSGKKGVPFKTQVEVVGGKITIPQANGPPLEIVNTVDTRIIIALEYDPELHPKGNARIIVLKDEQYEKEKEFRK